VRRLLAELGRLDGVTRLDLGRLSRGEVAAQLAGILGRPPDPAVATAVYERGGGNPSLTEVLLDADGMVTPGPPGPARDLLLGAVSELPADCQRVLRTAAVGGPSIGHRLLAAVTGQEGTALDDAVRPAVTAGVLMAGEAGYAFRHELFREAVLWDLLPGERVQAHRAFAVALETSPLLSPESLHLPSVPLALHWHGAGEDERALRAAWAAAGEACAAFAHAEELQMLGLALDLWDRVPGAARLVGTDRPARGEREDRAETRLPLKGAPPLLRPPHRRRARLRHRQRPRHQPHHPRLVPPHGPDPPHAVHSDAAHRPQPGASCTPGPAGRKKTSAAPRPACPQKPANAAANHSPRSPPGHPAQARRRLARAHERLRQTSRYRRSAILPVWIRRRSRLEPCSARRESELACPRWNWLPGRV
jgi:hypothetical protein